MKKIPNLNRKTIFRISAFLVVAALVVVFFPRGKSGFKYRYAENKPWGYTTLAAPFDFPLYKSDVQVEKERAQHMESFYPYFRFVPGQQQKILVVSYNDYEWLENNYKKIMVRTTDTKAKSHLITELTTPKNAYQGNQKIAYPQNLVYDTLYTEKMRAEKLAEIKDVEGQIFKGTKIIEEGEIVNAYTYRVLESLSRAYKEMAPGKQQRTLTLIGESILVLLFISLFVVYLFVFRNSYVQKTSVVLFFCLQILLVIALACLAMRFGLSIYVIPFAWVPILTRVFLDSRTANRPHRLGLRAGAGDFLLRPDGGRNGGGVFAERHDSPRTTRANSRMDPTRTIPHLYGDHLRADWLMVGDSAYDICLFCDQRSPYHRLLRLDLHL